MNKKVECPICKMDNLCKVEEKDSCWCMTINVPKSLISLLSSNEINKSCICKKCILSYKENELLFIKKYFKYPKR